MAGASNFFVKNCFPSASGVQGLKKKFKIKMGVKTKDFTYCALQVAVFVWM